MKTKENYRVVSESGKIHVEYKDVDGDWRKQHRKMTYELFDKSTTKIVKDGWFSKKEVATTETFARHEDGSVEETGHKERVYPRYINLEFVTIALACKWIEDNAKKVFDCVSGEEVDCECKCKID